MEEPPTGDIAREVDLYVDLGVGVPSLPGWWLDGVTTGLAHSLGGEALIADD
jgi:hypothetical protein